jgi:hypothetical protein
MWLAKAHKEQFRGRFLVFRKLLYRNYSKIKFTINRKEASADPTQSPKPTPNSPDQAGAVPPKVDPAKIKAQAAAHQKKKKKHGGKW